MVSVGSHSLQPGIPIRTVPEERAASKTFLGMEAYPEATRQYEGG